MKRIICWLLCCIIYQESFSQSSTAYKTYMQNLCTCLEKDTARVKSVNDASIVLGSCMNAIDTVLRNKAMQEKSIFKTDVEGLIQFEKRIGIDLIGQCPAFAGTIAKISNVAPGQALPVLPILDTIAANACRCLERKGITTDQNVVVKNLQDCLGASIIFHYDELRRQYKVTDQNGEALATLGEMAAKLVAINCTFFERNLRPVFNKKEQNN